MQNLYYILAQLTTSIINKKQVKIILKIRNLQIILIKSTQFQSQMNLNTLDCRLTNSGILDLTAWNKIDEQHT